MSIFVNKGALREQVRQYRNQTRALVHELYQLRRSFDEMTRRCVAAEEHIRNTEHFLAVLQAEQMPETIELT